MTTELSFLMEKLERERSLSHGEYVRLLEGRSPEAAAHLAQRADEVRRRIYGNQIYIRGLIEISNFCRNDCLYCGIRRSNSKAMRYRLTQEEILDCCREGYGLGFRTFVLQGGEDGYYHDDRLCAVVKEIKKEYPDCAVTLSLGERSRESYERLFAAGADRYLLRHETANCAHYASLHPRELTLKERLRCLEDLKQIGYQVGCGFMVGSPGQSLELLAEDLCFVQKFRPHMCGIGPFIPHGDTPFAGEKAGSVELTCYLLSILRLMRPNLLLPATTALGTLHPQGRELGVCSGANVVMPNLSPGAVRKKYMLYDNKLSDGQESAQCVAALAERMRAIGYEVVTHRGDMKAETMESEETHHDDI